MKSFELDYRRFIALRAVKETGLPFWVGGSISLKLHGIINRPIHDIDILTTNKELFDSMKGKNIMTIFYPDKDGTYQARIDSAEFTMIIAKVPEVTEFVRFTHKESGFVLPVAEPIYSVRAKAAYIVEQTKRLTVSAEQDEIEKLLGEAEKPQLLKSIGCKKHISDIEAFMVYEANKMQNNLKKSSYLLARGL